VGAIQVEPVLEVLVCDTHRFFRNLVH
jgi:hypothetical protein